ncbi:MAG TPA: DUF58 domain-containing protein [Planctomycetota bacterium]
MKRRTRKLPDVPERFPRAFLDLLHELLARGPRVPGGRTEHERTKRRALSQSGTFVGHRPYVRGDDLRRIDWAAYARSGELFVKQLEEEERRALTLLLDLSPSLLAGQTPRRLFMLRLAAIIGGLALRHLDGLLVIAPGAGNAAVASFGGPKDLDALLAHLDALPVAPATAEAAIGVVLQRGVAGRLHWLSDFVDPASCELPLAALRRRGAAVTGWLPMLAEDREPPVRGYLRLADLETGTEITIAVDQALAAEMRHQLELLARQQDRLFAQCGFPLRRWSVPAAGDFHASSWQQIVQWCSR